MVKTKKLQASQKHHPLKLEDSEHEITIHVSNRQKDLKISSRVIKRLVVEVLNFLGVSTHFVSIYFVSENAICNLHLQFFNDPSITDCISFPIDFEILGDVFVCPKVALEYKDPYQEVALYVIHGLLHLVGYDDLDSKSRRIMRKKEKECIAHCKAIINKIRPS